MDSEPPLLARKTSSKVESLGFNQEGDQHIVEEEDPYSLNGPSIALLGLAIAFLMVGMPLIAVLTERPSNNQSFLPTFLDRNGSKSSPPISFSRVGQPSC